MTKMALTILITIHESQHCNNLYYLGLMNNTCFVVAVVVVVCLFVVLVVVVVVVVVVLGVGV